MKFQVTTAGGCYSPTEAQKLETLGFKFKDGALGLEVTEDLVEINISTIEELVELQKEFGNLMISKDGIQILDDYLT